MVRRAFFLLHDRLSVRSTRRKRCHGVRSGPGPTAGSHADPRAGLDTAAHRRPHARLSLSLSLSLSLMRAVQITRFGGPEVLDVVDLPDPTPGEGQELFEVSAAGVNFANTHHSLSWNHIRRHSVQVQQPWPAA